MYSTSTHKEPFMSSSTTLVVVLILLFIGINMAANNSMITYILKYFFFSSTANMTLVRILGIAVLSTIVLILLDFEYYALIANVFIVIIFTFFTIRGRNKAKKVAEQKRAEKDAIYRAELEMRKKELAKTRARKIKELEDSRNKPKSIKDMKKSMWDDGSMTHKEIIRDLNKK